jgi:putative hydrolase of the HAD superfamily
VVFDWGGTLTPFHDADLVDLWRMVALELSPAHVAGITRTLAAAEARWWQFACGNGGSGTFTELLTVASTAVGVDVGGAVARVGAHRDLTHWTPHTVCDPEALLLLHLLRARGLKIGMLTNTRWPRPWHERLLARDGLLDLFDARVYTNDLPFSKPHPGAFQAVLSVLGIADPSSVMFVGDRPHTDLTGARALGMRTVLLADGAPPAGEPAAPHPDAVIGRLGLLLPILDRLGCHPMALQRRPA